MSSAQTVNKRLDPAVPVQGGPLKVWPRNYNQGDVKAIAESIRTNGFFGTIVAQESTGYILAGNHTFQAAQQAGLETLAVAWVDVDDESAARIALADNLTARKSSFDDRALAGLLQQLHDTELGLLGTGSTDAELRDLLAELEPAMTNKDVTADEDDVPPVPEEVLVVSQTGDIWVLGPHRVGCGSSLDPEHVRRLLDGRLADLVVTDPPYNVAYEGKTKDRLTIANDAMTPKEFRNFMTEAMDTTSGAMREGACIYVAYADSEAATFHDTFRGAGFKFSQVLVWVKHAPVLSRQDYNNQYEPIIYGWKPGGGHWFNGDFTQTTVIDTAQDYSRLSKDELVALLQGMSDASDVVRVKKPNRNGLHPTMKPQSLFRRLIQASSRPTELVYDPFGGSGTTLLASHTSGRVCYTNELDPRYVDVIVQRAQEQAGLSAVRESDGRSFDELKAERKALG
ncbi:DNA methyltransferase [Deinococcus sp. SL84]|uniref:DNA methyltransferase n=1 Tax=Deinococcus sp. SL84 TaxID=2994663 RepID=UPI002274EC94|nr:DNA methyltransferase [Deinococcus sp. SL84]MCY1703652.1 DNA methyltransferase [Deinococcus sp. SL84]